MRTPVPLPAPTPPPDADDAEKATPSAPRAKRRKWDFYETNADATEALVERIEIDDRLTIVEPCHGHGAITRILRRSYPHRIRTYDLDPEKAVDGTELADARTLVYEPDDAVITNPPFDQAFEILTNAHKQGVPCALLLRLSFPEPTLDRGTWLAEHPPEAMTVLPRHSYTGDGNSDSVTSAWMFWGLTSRFRVIGAPITVALTAVWREKYAREMARRRAKGPAD